MKSIHRSPVVEEGKHNIILQNRCGNRLTLLIHERWSELEFVYKPNAARRKDFRARNFSNRDNQTELFRPFLLPDLHASYVREFDYDPFVTRIHLAAPSLATNTLTLVNVLGANLFALAASRPLTCCFKPRQSFHIQEGLLSETFVDRGETICSFIAFQSFEENRFRITEDGTHVLQINENEILWLGGEENESRMLATLKPLRTKTLQELLHANEALLAPTLRKGNLTFRDSDFQRVLDFNKRIIFSGMDEGGACFGAINRIYYLIWNRDGSQTASMAARAGWPDLLRTWAPFILANPSVRRDAEGKYSAEWLQMLGTRWTKAEDDGIYYAFLSLFTLLNTTGDDTLLDTLDFDLLLDSLDHTIATRFDAEEGLLGSDVRGEADLRSSPNYGYDAVNGTMLHEPENVHETLPAFSRAYGLYHNTNLYNALRMAALLIQTVPQRHSSERAARYQEFASGLAERLRAKYVNAEGIFHADYVRLVDGTMRWIEFTSTDYEPDHWEYAWAVSVGPFFPDLPVALRSAAHVRQKWPTIKPYGYCPWNTLSRFLKEYQVLDSASFHEMLADEVREARLQTERFPMKDALTEYHGWVEGWRPLPFSAGSFLWATTSLLLQSLPQGLAVRASKWGDNLSNFHYHNSRLDVETVGEGDCVEGWSLNGHEISNTLQIPENLLRAGRNLLKIQKGEVKPSKPRLYASDARLVEATGNRLLFQCVGGADLVFEAMCEPLPIIEDSRGARPDLERIPLGSGLELWKVRVNGLFSLLVG